MLWTPLPGPQSDAYHSPAAIVGYGGAAGGGKTDLEIGLALTQHQRSIIYRREGTQLLSVRDRITEIIGSRDSYNGKDDVFRLENRRLELGGCKDIGSEKKYQGRAHDFKAFDEATEFAESQVRFLMGWLRSESKEIRKRVLMTFNPPTTVEGRWVIEYFGPWLKKGHAKPAEPGEIRWFTTHPKTGKDYEVDGPGPHRVAGETVMGLSRTFIPAKVEDNPFYMESGYKAVLQSMPEPLRSQMLKGDFGAGVEDDPWQVIPTPWVEAAQERWTPQFEGPMDSLGCDPARGGGDRTALCARYGEWFSEIDTYPGGDTPDGPAVAALCVAKVRDKAPIHVDVIGIGSSVHDHLKGALGAQSIPVNASESPKDKNSPIRFANRRSELWWRLREMLDPANSRVQLPPGDDLLAELTAPKYKMSGRGIQVEAKEDIKERLSRSPDKAEALLYASIQTMKATANLLPQSSPVSSPW